MSQLNDGGKGSTQRPYDKSKFDSNWDAIFGKSDALIKSDPDYKLTVITALMGSDIVVEFGDIVTFTDRHGNKEIFTKSVFEGDSKEYVLRLVDVVIRALAKKQDDKIAFRRNIPEGRMLNVSSEEEVDTDWPDISRDDDASK